MTGATGQSYLESTASGVESDIDEILLADSKLDVSNGPFAGSDSEIVDTWATSDSEVSVSRSGAVVTVELNLALGDLTGEDLRAIVIQDSTPEVVRLVNHSLIEKTGDFKLEYEIDIEVTD
jgi:hypothetical protein